MCGICWKFRIVLPGEISILIPKWQGGTNPSAGLLRVQKSGEPMISEWKAFLLESVAEWGLPRAGEWSFLFNNNYHAHYSGFNLLWFHDGSQYPRVVAKICREPRLVQREFENLKHAYRRAPAWVPRPLHFGSQGEFWMLWMEGVPGLPFGANAGSSPAVLRSMVEMLGLMHGAFRKDAVEPGLDRYRRMISQPLQTLGQFGPSASVREGCAMVAAKTSVEWVDSQPVIPQHGDLFRANVLLYRRQWHVIDWENFGMTDFPFYDLLTLLFSLLLGGGETPDQWDSSLVKQVPVLIECYAQGLGLSPADVPLLLPLTLANWFHLQWSDGRKEFTMRMYRTIQDYFEHVNVWERVFLSRQVPVER
jgi:hypothetical protein